MLKAKSCSLSPNQRVENNFSEMEEGEKNSVNLLLKFERVLVEEEVHIPISRIKPYKEQWILY